MMNGNKKFTCKQLLSTIIMLVALAWLTVSLPFVYAGQQAQKAAEEKLQLQQPVEEDTNPLTNTTEEKTESGTNTLSEYLHDFHIIEHTGALVVKYYKCHSSDLYFAYHPELISPPPDIA
jgi:hypothetical protein